MAPPETTGGGNAHESEAQSTNSSSDPVNPCDKTPHARGPVTDEVDQDHKACDDHTEGERFPLSTSMYSLFFLWVLATMVVFGIVAPLCPGRVGATGCKHL